MIEFLQIVDAGSFGQFVGQNFRIVDRLAGLGMAEIFLRTRFTQVYFMHVAFAQLRYVQRGRL